MPFGDGTGPFGTGPWGWRGRGICRYWGLWGDERAYLERLKSLLELELKEINKRLETLKKNNA